MKRLALLTALLALAATAQAAPEIYIIDNSQSVTNFSFKYLGVPSRANKFEKTSGKVMFDHAHNTGSVDVTIDATSINTGYTIFNNLMQSGDFFDSANFPVITFKSNKMTLDGNNMYMSGDLTIKNMTRPVTLTISRFECVQHPVYKVEACEANVSVTVKRSDFNMGKFSMLASNEVTLDITIGAMKADPLIQLAARDNAK